MASETGGDWVTVRPPGAPSRQDWVPDEQPDSPDGSPGRWHVVGQAGEQGRWEWVRADDPILEPVGQAAGRVGQESMMAPPGSYASPSPSSYYAQPTPPPAPAAPPPGKSSSAQMSFGSLGASAQALVKRIRNERRLWAPVGLGVFLVLVLLYLLVSRHHKSAAPVATLPVHPFPVVVAPPPPVAKPAPVLGATQLPGVPATHVPVQAGDWRLDSLRIDKDPNGPDFIANGVVTYTGSTAAPAGQFTIVVYRDGTKIGTLQGTSKAAATAGAPAAAVAPGAGAPAVGAAPAAGSAAAATAAATPTPVDFTSSDAFQNGSNGFTFKSG